MASVNKTLLGYLDNRYKLISFHQTAIILLHRQHSQTLFGSCQILATKITCQLQLAFLLHYDCFH